MHAIYLACLFGGLVASVLFAALGAMGGAGHGATQAHLGHGPTHALPSSHAQQGGAHPLAHPATQGHGVAHPAPSAHSAPSPHAMLGWTLSWVNPLALAAAALWFGGAGLLAEGLLPGALLALAIPLAVVAAVLGAALVRAMMAALIRASTPPLHDGAAGALGTINAPIRADAVGEVLYTLEGLARSAPARSLDGRPLPRGTAVVIVRREKGIAWVAPLDPLEVLPQPETAAPAEASPTSGSGDLSPP